MKGRFTSVRRRCAAILLAVAATSGCANTISLPLGGVTSGRGRPLGAGGIQFSGAIGTFAEVGGALPALVDSLGIEVNPIPAVGRGVSRSGGLDLLGLSYGVSDRVDVGLNFSRGLHGFVRLVGNDSWSLTASPSLLRYSAEAGGVASVEPRRGVVTNISLLVLGSYDLPIFEDRRIEVFGGGALSRYSAEISTDTRRVQGHGVVPSLIGGVRALRAVPRPAGPRAPPQDGYIGVSLEGGWTWMRQRDSRQDVVPTLRAYLTIGGGTRR